MARCMWNWTKMLCTNYIVFFPTLSNLSRHGETPILKVTRPNPASVELWCRFNSGSTNRGLGELLLLHVRLPWPLRSVAHTSESC